MEANTFSRQTYFISILILITLALFCQPKTCLAQKNEVPYQNSNIEFIKTSCGVTLYPHVCYQTLSAFASTIQTSPTKLANIALNVTLKTAQKTSNVMENLLKAHNLKSREVSALKDCVETLEDSVDELRQSMEAMKFLQGPGFELQMNNIQTWVSAALTDEDTCVDGFEEIGVRGKVRVIVRGYIVRVAQLTSNALALINRLS